MIDGDCLVCERGEERRGELLGSPVFDAGEIFVKVWKDRLLL